MADGRATLGRTLLLLALAALALVAQARADSSGPATALESIEAARARGEIDDSEAARQTLYCLFDRTRLDPRWGGPDEPKARCGTTALAASMRRTLLDPEVRALLEAYLAPAVAAPATYRTAHFEIDYATSGPDAPPQTDVAPANGIPDFVERAGEACEHSWAVEVDQLGYTPPPLQGGSGGRYPVTFQAQESYGYTVVVSGERTRMVLHPDYAGFPPNQDPDGDALGSLRVTVAHELKHAIQRTYTPWFEDQWLELDATWIEDLVYDEVDDYLNFIRRSQSPFTDPDLALDLAGGGSYEDCNWQHYLTERFGLDHMLDFWDRRRAIPAEPVLSTYAATIGAEGVSFAQAWGEYTAWNAATGVRAGPGFGYGESALYPTAPATSTHTTLPVTDAQSSAHHLAAGIHLVANQTATLAGEPRFTFTSLASPAASWGVSVVFRDRGGQVTRTAIPLSAGAGALALTGLDWAGLEWAALVVGHATEGGSALPYMFSIDGLAALRITHLPVPVTAALTPVAVKALVMDGTSALDPTSVTLTWRAGEGPESTEPMLPTSAPSEFGAEIPGQLDGVLVRYRIEARSTSSQPMATPALPGMWHECRVVSAFENFETAGTWTVGDAGDGATSGVWERVQPVGTSAAPHEDATPAPGTIAFVTANGVPNGAAGAADVDSGRTTLMSPVFAFATGRSWDQALVRYRRWYSNHVGTLADDAFHVDLSNDGGATWSRAESVTEGGEGWTPVTLDLIALFGAPDRVRIRFVAEDAGNPSLVEAGVDDFEILAVLSDPVAVGNGPGAPEWLGAPSPNPSRGRDQVRMRLAAGAPIEAWVRDVQGRRVRHLAPSPGQGSLFLVWDGLEDSGREAPAGLYFVEARAGERRGSRPIVRLH